MVLRKDGSVEGLTSASGVWYDGLSALQCSGINYVVVLDCWVE